MSVRSNREIVLRYPAEVREVFLLRSVYNDSGTQPASYSTETSGVFSRRCSGQWVKFTTHLHLVTTLTIYGQKHIGSCASSQLTQGKLLSSISFISDIPLSCINYRIVINPSAPNDVYIRRTAQLTSRRCILNIYSTNILTEYFKHAAHSPFFSLQDVFYFIMLYFLVPVIFTF